MNGSGFQGRSFRRGEPGYEEARRATVWNAFTPERFPDLVVQAADEDDLVRAVRLAGKEGMKIGVRSGGHSWAGNHVRDGGLLLDVSGLDAVEIDAEARTAVVGPGCRGNELLAALAERDLFWAARGSGPGFFGAVARFHLRLYERPRHVANGVVLYPLDALEEVFAWAHEVGPRVPREVELMVVVHRDFEGEPEIAVTVPALVDSAEEAAEALRFLETCPGREGAKLSVPNVEVTLPDLYAAVRQSYPDGHRYAVDNMWTHAPVEELLPGLRRIAETLPGAPSHMLWMNWGPSPPRPEMAYSVEDETYIALYGVWSDPAEDEAYVGWATERVREMEGLASGIQLADENLGRRPARFAGEANMARLDEVRTAYDPGGIFHPWMGRL